MLHLDHCADREFATACLRAGWDSVLFDTSGLPYESALRQTAELVESAREYGGDLKGEFEAIPRVGEVGEGQEHGPHDNGGSACSELLGVNAVGAFDLSVQARDAKLDVSVGDPLAEDVPGEGGLEFGAVVGLDDLDLERQTVNDVRAMLHARVLQPITPRETVWAPLSRYDLREDGVMDPVLHQLPAAYWTVPYVSSRFPGSSQVADLPRLEEGANCQLFAYEVLRHFGLNPPDLRSSELWADTQATVHVSAAQPLDLVLFNATDDAYGAHVGVWVNEGHVLHLCAEVGRPVVWEMTEFMKRQRYRVLIGTKRVVDRPQDTAG